MNEGQKEPGPECRYLARDGLYYNGYTMSTDYIEDTAHLYDEVFNRIRADASPLSKADSVLSE